MGATSYIFVHQHMDDSVSIIDKLLEYRAQAREIHANIYATPRRGLYFNG